MIKNLNKLVDKPVEILWYDIISEIREKKAIIVEKPLCDLASLCHTYGILERYDEKFIMIKTEDAEDELDFTVIPQGCILNINKLIQEV